MGSSLGSGLRGFKQAISGEHVDQLPEMTVTPMIDTAAEAASDPASNHTAPTAV